MALRTSLGFLTAAREICGMTVDNIARAADYTNAWAATVHHRSQGGRGYPHRSDIDEEYVARPPRHTPDYLPTVALRYMTVESFLHELGNPKMLIALLLHCYPNSGAYYRPRSISSFRHPHLNRYKGDRYEILADLLRQWREQLAARLS